MSRASAAESHQITSVLDYWYIPGVEQSDD